ncbi:hypothetical protein VNO77_35201 [Canavalia gladiata]|uniref:Malectin-like domain-containing protein n=1 Tax=Canavalia gladiata TaxID=3824 RepID=A0AAN9PYW3_CANGL
MRFNSITSIVFLLHLSIHLQAYTPVVNFTVSCGATGKSFDGERTWTGDIDSKLLSVQDGTVSATATTQSPSAKQIPYATGRFSRSQFTYSFPVTTGPQFLRLFFYPAQYPSFSRNDASFTVKSNQFTLLKDFNASLTADVEKTETIFREYIINVDESQKLNLSFTPTQPNSYAFINGIEILSMPNDLYYTSPNDQGIELVGSNTQYTVESSVALETGYRVKVGGQRISPRNDVGLFRDWTGHDEVYLKTPSALYSVPADLDNRNVTVKPDYVAPADLYRTARDMGLNGTLNKSLNLTWEFPVDSGFGYMLRLHFCELNPNITVNSDRAFIIYIASQVAEERADVMKWTHTQKGLAVQRLCHFKYQEQPQEG